MNRSTLDLKTADGVRAWRLAHQLTQRELAGKLEVHWQTVNRWENGQTPIPKTAALALAYLSEVRQA